MHPTAQLPSRRETHHSTKSKSKSTSRWMLMVNTMIRLFLIGLGLLLAFSVFTLLYLRSHALPQTTLQQTSFLVDRHGKWIDAFYHEQNRAIIKLTDMSPQLIQATLAIEDHRFYQHLGIDPKAILRALLVNVEHRKVIQGAGTITQQLARNSYLTHERTWTRKWKETIYALQLELQFSKDAILEKYLNQIYYGHATYGIELAAKLYFGKSARDLNLAECAMLAGIPKGPLYYSPYLNWHKAKQRQKLVLQRMSDLGYITAAQLREASEQPLHLKQSLLAHSDTEAPYFRDYVKSQAMQILNFSEEQLEQSGFTIHTTLDLDMQQKAEQTVKKYVEPFAELQVALVSMDPRDGQIRAMIGGRDYKVNQYNRVFSQSRQPGSAFKPIVYIAALQQGHTPLLTFTSEPTLFTYEDGKKTYAPQNFGNHYLSQPIQMRQAIATSDNIYAVHTLQSIGAERVIEIAQQLGVRSPLPALPSLALGASPISPFEMVQVYSVLANQGRKAEPQVITKIEDAFGKVLYRARENEVRVIDPAYSYMMTHLLQSVFEPGGTAYRVAKMMHRPIAGKTGSTDTDSWMVGYTPELTTAVWLGYDKDRKIGSLESHQASPLFVEFTELALEGQSATLFSQPEEVSFRDIDPLSGKLSNADCPKSKTEVFLKGTEPREYCTPTQSPPPSSQPPLPLEQSDDSWWKEWLNWWTISMMNMSQ